MMLQPDQPVEVILPAATWNDVMRVMAEAPVAHRIVDPLIRAIQGQCMQAMPQQQQSGPQTPRQPPMPDLGLPRNMYPDGA